MSCRQYGYPWPSLATSPYHSSPPAGLQGYILCPHIVAVCKFELVILLLHGHTRFHKLWQSSFSRVYSNSCSRCLFEAEIIKIGQSSHKMYSNNIMNFQESTTILNACTKKNLETYWMHHVRWEGTNFYHRSSRTKGKTMLKHFRDYTTPNIWPSNSPYCNPWLLCRVQLSKRLTKLCITSEMNWRQR